MSRCEAMIQYREKGHSLKRPGFKQIIFGKSKIEAELETKLIDKFQVIPEIAIRRVDLCEMIGIMFGNIWKNIYMFGLFVVGVLSLVSYTVIFASSLTSNINIGFLESCNMYDSVGFLNDCRKTY